MPDLTNNTALNRFEMPVDGQIAFVVYRRHGDVLQLNHAEVPTVLEGRGIGSQLVRATLDHVRVEGLKVVPRCPFIASFMRRNPEYADLLAT